VQLKRMGARSSASPGSWLQKGKMGKNPPDPVHSRAGGDFLWSRYFRNENICNTWV